jgi:MSHA biogenesis protein MshJ
VYAAWDSLFYQPLQLKQKSLQQEQITLKAQLDSQQQAMQQLQNRDTQRDPNAEQTAKLQELKAHYQGLQNQLMSGDKKFVPPSLMAKVLSDVLNQNQQLSLLELKTLPISSLVASKELAIYKHGLSIRFSGDYMATLLYLSVLESLPWHFIWDNIEYHVTDYPQAEITIRIYTLSFEEKWLDV